MLHSLTLVATSETYRCSSVVKPTCSDWVSLFAQKSKAVRGKAPSGYACHPEPCEAAVAFANPDAASHGSGCPEGQIVQLSDFEDVP